MAKKSPSPKPAEGKYSVTATFNGETRVASGDTVADALLALGISALKTKAVFVFSNVETGKSHTRAYLPRVARRFLVIRPVAEAFGKVITAAIG